MIGCVDQLTAAVCQNLTVNAVTGGPDLPYAFFIKTAPFFLQLAVAEIKLSAAQVS